MSTAPSGDPSIYDRFVEAAWAGGEYTTFDWM